MLKVRFKKVNTPFKLPFTTQHETKTHQPALLIAIEYNGFRGIGEIAVISYYPQTMESLIADLQAKAQMIEQYAFTEPERFWHFCHHLYPDNPFLVSGLDLAYWDLYSQVKKQSIGMLVNGKETASIETFYTLGQDKEEIMQVKMEQQPWPFYKVKVTDEESVEILGAVMQNSKSQFAVDANEAWSLEEAKKMIPKLEELGVLFIEQPLAKEDIDAMVHLKRISNIPFFADESFQLAKDLECCATVFDGINVKLSKCSGLSPALKIIEQAKELGLKTMLGCMNETEVGAYPAAQIGSLVDYCDLDGPILLDTNLKKMQYEAGKIILS